MIRVRASTAAPDTSTPGLRLLVISLQPFSLAQSTASAQVDKHKPKIPDMAKFRAWISSQARKLRSAKKNRTLGPRQMQSPVNSVSGRPYLGLASVEKRGAKAERVKGTEWKGHEDFSCSQILCVTSRLSFLTFSDSRLCTQCSRLLAAFLSECLCQLVATRG